MQVFSPENIKHKSHSLNIKPDNVGVSKFIIFNQKKISKKKSNDTCKFESKQRLI